MASLMSYDRAAMTAQKMMLNEFAWDERYRVRDVDEVLTPALVVYPEMVAANISRTLQLLEGDASRWRVHIKTSKLAYTLRMLVERGVRNFKCATTLELLTACRSGAEDVLVAYPMVGANARRVQEIAEQFPKVKIGVLVENREQVMRWRSGSVGVFIDINPGMNRTGVEQDQSERILQLAREIGEAGLEFRGLHYYDGQFHGMLESERKAAAHAGYDRLIGIVKQISESGVKVQEVITAGTPTFPCSLEYAGFRGASFVHRVSPGTVVYGDASSLAELPANYGYRPAALVITRVVSHPHGGVITCDAGHKTVSADSGVPTCLVVGHAELTPLGPSEEHLPMRTEKLPGCAIGEVLYLLPRHICPTVNNFDAAVIARDGRIESVEQVSARGREAPLSSAKLIVA